MIQPQSQLMKTFHSRPAKQFNACFEHGTFPRGRNQRGRMFGEVVIMDVHCAGNQARLYYIETVAIFRGMGAANKALEWLCELADQFNMELTLGIVPYVPDMGYGELFDWYSKFGFKQYIPEDLTEMKRYPHVGTN